MNAAASAPLKFEPPFKAPVSQPEPEPAVRVPVLLFGLCFMLFFAILSFGAVETWSVSIVEAGAAMLFLGWAAGQVISGELEIQASPLYAPAFLFAAVVAAQLGFGLTAYRYATLIASLEYLAYGIVLFLTLQSLTNERSAKALLWALAWFGFGLAVFAIAQDLTANGKIYWVRTLHNGGSIFGPYVNHDHYAGLMEMLAPFPIVLSLGSLIRGGKRVLVGFAGVVMAGTIVLSQSRAGTASFLVEMGVLLGLLVWRKRNGRIAASVGAICLMVLAFVAWLGTAALWHHFTELQDWMRLAITKDGLRMFWHKPVLGWGLGTFTIAYPEFRSFYTNLFVNAAHNDYVQVLAETGFIGFAAVLWFIVEVYRAGLGNMEGWSRDWPRALGLAALIGCTGLLVHSFFDFNLQIPANACMFYFLCAMATRTPQLREKSRQKPHAQATA
jgi:O-antigen ligase